MASCSFDKTVRIWDILTGACLKTLNGHSAAILGVAYSPCGSVLASGGEDGTVRLWDVTSGECTKVFKHKKAVWHVAYAPDGLTLASGSYDSTVYVWNVLSDQCIKKLVGHVGYIYGVAYSPDGRMLATSAWDKTIRIWGVESGQCIKTLYGHSSPVWDIAFSPNGQQLISGSGEAYLPYLPGKDLSCSDNSVRLWDVPSGLCLQVLNRHRGAVRGVAYSSDGLMIASSSEDNSVHRWLLAAPASVLVGDLSLINWLTVVESDKQPVSTERLILHDIPLEASHAILLSQLLVHHQSLMYLDIRGTGLNTFSRELLISSLKPGSACKQLLIDMDDLSDKAKKQYSDYFSPPKTLPAQSSKQLRVVNHPIIIDSSSKKSNVIQLNSSAKLLPKEWIFNSTWKKDNSFQSILNLNKANLASLRAISQLVIDNDVVECKVIPSKPDGDCGLTAIRRYLALMNREDLANHITRSGIVQLVTNAQNMQDAVLQELVAKIVKADNVGSVMQWAEKFAKAGKDGGIWLHEDHLQFLSYQLNLRFHVCCVGDDSLFHRETVHEIDLVSNVNRDVPVTVHLAYVSTVPLNLPNARLNHFEGICLNPTQQQKLKITDYAMQGEDLPKLASNNFNT